MVPKQIENAGWIYALVETSYGVYISALKKRGRIVKLVYTDGSDKDFVKLCKMLDDNLNEIVGGEVQRSQYNQYNTLGDIHDVVLAYCDNIPVGCASFKFFDERSAEVKRVYVQKEYRGKGISKRMMTAIEERARSRGFSALILETGAPLIEAMGLYTSLGFKIIENYGTYKNMRESICMQKEI